MAEKPATDICGAIADEALHFVRLAVENAAERLNLDEGTAAEVLKAQWVISYPVFCANNGIAMGLPEDSLTLPVLSGAASAAFDKVQSGTRNQRDEFALLSLSWGSACAAQRAVAAKRPAEAVRALTVAAWQAGYGRNHYWAAVEAGEASRAKAKKKAEKGAEKRALIEAKLPEIIDQHIMNARHKRADQIARELVDKGVVSLDLKVLRKMVAAEKRRSR